MRKPLSVFVRKKTKGSTRHFRGATCLTNGAWGFLHIPAKRFNPGSHRQNDDGSDPDFSQFPKDFVHIDASGLFTELVASVWSASTSPRSRTLTWILHDTGSDRLGITAIYLSLIDMHVVFELTRKGPSTNSEHSENEGPLGTTLRENGPTLFENSPKTSAENHNDRE